MMTQRRWIIPLVATESDGPAIVVKPTNDHCIQIDGCNDWRELSTREHEIIGVLLDDVIAFGAGDDTDRADGQFQSDTRALLRRLQKAGALPQLEPLTACQLGQALLDASAYVGQQRAKRTR